MTIFVKPLLFKPHRLNGLSERLLQSHYENNYGGALRRLNRDPGEARRHSTGRRRRCSRSTASSARS